MGQELGPGQGRHYTPGNPLHEREALPCGGEIVLFDRSWYNRAMVERVFSYCNEKEYYDFMRGVVGFERDLVRQDTLLVKLYFRVTKEEQARRVDRRKTDPLRQWKLSEVDRRRRIAGMISPT